MVAKSLDQKDAGAAIWKEASGAIPHPPAGGVEVLLPKVAGVGRCRICGQELPLTREHIPPSSAGNVGQPEAHTLGEWLARSGLHDMPGGEVLRHGIAGYTLCGPCNNHTGGAYGTEYLRWAATIAKMMLEQAPPIAKLDQSTQRRAIDIVLGTADGPMRPGAFVRQALAMLCSVSSDYDLAGTYPTIRRLILERTVEPLPDGMSLYLTIFLGPGARLVGPSLTAETSTGDWRWILEVAFPPLAFLLVLAAKGEVPVTWNISGFTQLPTTAAQVVKATADIGFGHTALPGDYRTRAQIERGD